MNSLNIRYVSLVTLAAAFFSVSGSVPVQASPKSQGYFAKKIPPAGANCHEQARELAARFTQITGIVGAGRCYEATESGNDILITYDASEPLEVLSSATEIGFPGQGYEFSTKAQCEGELGAEVNVFKTMTGTEPLLAFCRGDENYYGRVRWALIVEGFAKLSTKNAWASSLFPGLPDAALISRIKNEAKAEFTDGVTSVRHVFLQDDEHGHLRFTVNYYGKYDEQIKSFALSSVTTMDQCRVAQSEMDAIKSQTPGVKTLSYCVNNPYDAGVDLVVVVDVTRWYGLRQSAEMFKTYEECSAAKNPLLDVYRSNYPQRILGGFCTEWGSNWKINILELAQ